MSGVPYPVSVVSRAPRASVLYTGRWETDHWATPGLALYSRSRSLSESVSNSVCVVYAQIEKKK